MFKICYKCGINKEKSDFGRNKSKNDGLTTECKECIKLLYKEYIAKKIAKNPNYYKDWYSKNKESVKKSHIKFADKIKEKSKIRSKIYYEKNKEIIKERGRLYAQSERGSLMIKAYYQVNKEKNKDKKKDYNLRRLYGITLEQYNSMMSNQNGSCLICKDKPNILHVDHCHNTKLIRGLLCSRCNLVLGQFEDNLKLFENAILYLKNK